MESAFKDTYPSRIAAPFCCYGRSGSSTSPCEDKWKTYRFTSGFLVLQALAWVSYYRWDDAAAP